MRSDMFEVIIERPRLNWARGMRLKGRKAEVARLHPERSPRTEPMSIGRGTKELNENLAPLQRFLARNVGRPWSAVRSEMCAHIAPKSAVQKHVLDHVKEMVEVNPVMIDGRPYEPAAMGSRRDDYRPITSYRFARFYVCPRTGLLRMGPKRDLKSKAHATEAAETRKLGEMLEARKIEGIWYAITFARVPAMQSEREACFDVVLKARLSGDRMLGWSGSLKQTYGTNDRFAIAKRQLSKREIRAHGLGLA